MRIWKRSSMAAALAAAAAAACTSGSGGHATGGNGGGHGTSSSGTASSSSGTASSSSGTASSSSGGGTGGAMPDPGCVVPDVTSAATNITVQGSPSTTAATVFEVTDADTGHTNVALSLCTTAGEVTPAFGGVDSGQAPFAWHWVSGPLPAGPLQAVFRADPSGTVYRTAWFTATAGDGGPVEPPPGLCDAPPGNLIAHGTFEEGTSGLAPAGWQVRDPSLPNGSCLSSGTPAEHVYISTGAPACGGHALTIDALGQWDCYAIQSFSDYNTIDGGFTYRISATVRAQGNAVNPAAWFVLGAQWLDGNDTVFGDIKNPKPASSSMNDFDWQVMWFDVVAPADAKRIVVWLSGHYPGRVDYDNVSVVKVGP